MIYFTTFIFTLLLSHIARAVPACGDDASPKGLYDPTYDDVQQPIQPPHHHKITWDRKYDHRHGDTKSVTCSHLAHRYPHFKDFPQFPNIGAAFDIHGPPHCGKCWKLHHKNKSISLTAIDHAAKGFKISKEAFEKLNGGPGTEFEARAERVADSVCGF